MKNEKTLEKRPPLNAGFCSTIFCGPLEDGNSESLDLTLAVERDIASIGARARKKATVLEFQPTRAPAKVRRKDQRSW